MNRVHCAEHFSDALFDTNTEIQLSQYPPHAVRMANESLGAQRPDGQLDIGRCPALFLDTDQTADRVQKLYATWR